MSGTVGSAPTVAVNAQATLPEGLESERAAGLLAKSHPIVHGWLIPKVHRLRGWKTQQYRLTPPPPDD
jgi:hypothetical protein